MILKGISTSTQVATVLTVYGIETFYPPYRKQKTIVATVLTVYGIETELSERTQSLQGSMLQQYLPFTVLKHCTNTNVLRRIGLSLQQYLPFTVLKQHSISLSTGKSISELQQHLPFTVLKLAFNDK